MTDPTLEGPLWSSSYLTGGDGIWGTTYRVWVTRELMESPTSHPNGRTREDLRLLASDGEVKFKRESGGQLRVLHSYAWRVSQRTRVLQLSRTLRCLKARARPGKFASVFSFVNYATLPVHQERPLSNSGGCTVSLLLACITLPLISIFSKLIKFPSFPFPPFQ